MVPAARRVDTTAKNWSWPAISTTSRTVVTVSLLWIPRTPLLEVAVLRPTLDGSPKHPTQVDHHLLIDIRPPRGVERLGLTSKGHLESAIVTLGDVGHTA